MRRHMLAVAGAFLAALLAATAYGQNITPTSKYVLFFDSAPVQFQGPADCNFYDWSSDTLKITGNGGQSVSVAGTKGRHALRMRAFLVDFDAKKVFTFDETVSFIIGEAPPPDDPDDPDDPVIPDGVHGLTKFSYDEASKVAGTAKAKAEALGDNFAGVSAAIAAGGLKSISEANAALLEQNREVIGDDRDAWLGFFQQLNTRLVGLNQQGKLATVKDHVEPYKAIADGLKLVK